MLIVVIQGSIWINFSIPTLTGTGVFFMSYLVVSSIQMGANIDYAIVIASRYQEIKGAMSHREAMTESLNFAFPTVMTSGTIMTVAGILIGGMTSEAAIVGIGQSIGRGTIISMILVLFVLPQILLLGGGIADKTSFFHALCHQAEGGQRPRVCRRFCDRTDQRSRQRYDPRQCRWGCQFECDLRQRGRMPAGVPAGGGRQ